MIKKFSMDKYNCIAEFGSKTNANIYIGAGWELIETRAEPFAWSRTIIIYQVGWPEGTGKPATLTTDEDLL